MNSIADQIRHYLIIDILPGESPDAIQADTNLRETGILDSLSTLKLVSFLEEKFHVAFEVRDLEGDNFASISNIERMLHTKMRARD